LWAVGLLLSAISLINLGASTRLGLPASQTSFKTHGIYRFSRNPMYLGFDLLTLGAIACNPHVVIAVMGLYSMIVYHLIILGEEKFLRQRFGDTYAEYADRVRRYF
jgi:protein-S-isoprenylcysteine O-methyltransferase Ste14